ncbi:MAG: pilin [bacterium]
MIKSIKSKLYALAAVITVVIPLTFSGITYAQYNVINATNTNGCDGAVIMNGNTTSGASGCTNAQNGLNVLFSNILNILSWIVGTIAVILIVVAGFRYIISGGESGGTAAAKNSILYAIVGLVIVALAQIIVQFVLHKSTATTNINN